MVWLVSQFTGNPRYKIHVIHYFTETVFDILHDFCFLTFKVSLQFECQVLTKLFFKIIISLVLFLFLLISSTWFDFSGTGEADCSIVGGCSYGGAGEAGRSGEICCTTVWSCSPGGI